MSLAKVLDKVDESRVARVDFTIDLPKQVFIDALNIMPDDTEIIRCHHDYFMGINSFIVRSNKFPPLNKGSEIPNIMIICTKDGEKITTKIQYPDNSTWWSV